ncbi:hypothetical protein HDU77_000829 [Chytriomyces hyalinus]|nr:hypothetical protein HDU77_000829 [Chytriomyces hyalinus]
MRKMKFVNTLTQKLRPDPLTPGSPFEFERVSPAARVPRQVPAAHFSFVPPTFQPDAKLLSVSRRGLELIGLKPDAAEHDADFLLGLTSGNEVPSGTNPWALNYGGHQFGSWAQQLGDGRAICLGEIEVANKDGSPQRIELQLKGAGMTPYSRFADGFAVLRSSIREYLAAEAMHSLGVPTSRSLSLVLSSRGVAREEGLEPGAVVCRLAPSWIRFGSFEVLYWRGQLEMLKELADYTIENHFPHVLSESANIANERAASNSTTTLTFQEQLAFNKYILWIKSVVEKTADMIAHWQSVGFCHGVMNTDNFSILGLTIDYGPYQFLNTFEPGYICNHSDHTGRYAFNQQPRMAMWNLVRLVNVLDPLLATRLPSKDSPIPKEEEEAIMKALGDTVHLFGPRYEMKFNELMGKKLGFLTPLEDDLDVVHQPLLKLLFEAQLDYTLFYRTFSESVEQVLEAGAMPDALFDQFYKFSFKAKNEWDSETGEKSLKTRFQDWTQVYIQRLETDKDAKSSLKSRMLNANPKFILRNHIVQKVIDEVTVDPTSSVIDRYLRVLENPFENGSAADEREFGGAVPALLRDLKCSCSS